MSLTSELVKVDQEQRALAIRVQQMANALISTLSDCRGLEGLLRTDLDSATLTLIELGTAKDKAADLQRRRKELAAAGD